LEIQKKDRLMRPGMTVIDLGAAPGGWSQVAHEIVGNSGQVIAMDILPMEPMAGVHLIQGDCREEIPFLELQAILQDKVVDLVLSDMAPNLSGIMIIDQPKILGLAEMALEFALVLLKNQGSFLVKLFQGSGVQEFIARLKPCFKTVLIRKPEASRSESREMYVLAKGFIKERVGF
jgi:23S rRNA (uridine2552-2'-O)-methyltransferase